MQVTMLHVRQAMLKTKAYPNGRCAACLSEGVDLPATAKEINSCSFSTHVRIMRSIYRSARNIARRATGIR